MTSEFLTGPFNALPDFDVPGMQSFLNAPGSIVNIPPNNYMVYYDNAPHDTNTVYPNAIKNHAIVPIEHVVEAENYIEIDKESKVGYLIENIATGLHYFVYAEAVEVGEKGSYRVIGVADFKGSKEEPYDIILSEVGNMRWRPSSIDALGTRVGGIPLSSDGNRYHGLWPHLKDGRQLSFVAQYQLEDKRYIHLFTGCDFDDYDYSSMEDDRQDPYSCAFIEGGPVPAWIQMKTVETSEQKLVHPEVAYTRKESHSGIVAAPLWIQDDYTPGRGEYDFMIQIGDTDMLEDEMDFLWGDAGALYLFADMKTNRVKAIMQSS